MPAIKNRNSLAQIFNGDPLIHHEVGAKVTREGVVYTVWCPEHRSVVSVIQSPDGGHRQVPLEPLELGYFQGTDPSGQAGDLYFIVIDGQETSPDFASRFQPKGVFGPSQVVDSFSYRWQSLDWKRPAWGGHVIYELHVGTFTPGGTYLSAIERLDHLKNLGVTVVELMPLAAWNGERNWGYDGVLLFSPHHDYGTPDHLRTLIDACHSRGLAVMLDVVFNHLGAVGNHSSKFSPYYFHADKHSPWGSCFNLDGSQSGPVRSLLLQNINYWLTEFRIDGFRMDATHAIHDESPTHILAEIAWLVHEAGGFIVAEDERNENKILLSSDEGGWGFDGVWADDFHHSVITSQKNYDEIYRDSYLGTAEEIAETLRGGWLYKGKVFPFNGKPRGTEFTHPESDKLVYCLANHDQTGNRPAGEFFHQLVSESQYRASSLFFLLVPYTPLLFMGQEWGTNSNFFYFTDFPDPLGSKLKGYRQAEMKELFRRSSVEELEAVPDPQSIGAFNASKLNWSEINQESHLKILNLYQKGLKLRKELFGKTNPPRKAWSVEAIENRVRITYHLPDRIVKVTLNLGLLGLPLEENEQMILSSNDPRFVTELGEGPETTVTEIK